MDVDRSHGELAEDALGREIRAALAVTPSPLFLARVRARIANEPRSSVWGRPRVFVAAGVFAVAAVAAAVGVVTVQRPQTLVRQMPASAQPARDQQESPLMQSLDSGAGARRQLVDRRRPRVTARQKEAENLVSTSDARAFRTLFEAARAGKIQVAIPDRPAAEEPIEDIVVPPIAVPDITIEPLQAVAQ